MPETDRLAAIKGKIAADELPSLGDLEWLLAEAERGRRIEDAAIEWHRVRTFRSTIMEMTATVAALRAAIRRNPRPRQSDG